MTDKDILAAQAEFISSVVVGIVRQACEQGVDFKHAAATVLTVGAKCLHVALGPDEAAAFIRSMAETVEADRAPRQFDA